MLTGPNLYLGSVVVATAAISGLPVLVDYKYGNGRVLLTGQTLEFAWKFDWDGKPILENSILSMLSKVKPPVLILRDNTGWGLGVEAFLDSEGIIYTKMTTTQLAIISNLSYYKIVAVAGNQLESFDVNWNAQIGKIEAFVNQGGKLWQNAALLNSNAGNFPTAPGGVRMDNSHSESSNDILIPSHPWVKDVPNPMSGTATSHSSMHEGTLYPGTKVIARGSISLKPTLVDYMFGKGRVFLSTHTFDFAWFHSQDAKIILENSLRDFIYPASDFYFPIKAMNGKIAVICL